jgi:cell division transport system ATP-binding protein
MSTTSSRLTEVPAKPSPAPIRPGAAGGTGNRVIELSGVGKRYRRLVALRNVNLAISAGEMVFVIGPSEAGKTTLLKLMHGDVRPNRGTVEVLGHPLHQRWGRRLPQLRRRVAAVFQDHRLLTDMSVRGNVAFALQVTDLGMPGAEARARAQARLDEVGLGTRAAAHPGQLSGGQQRRLAIARALGHAPVLLLADEPTANLDRRNADRVLQLLEARCRAGTTVVVATHDTELALAGPHRVIELREGKIVAERPARVSPPGAAAVALAQHGNGSRRPRSLAPRVSSLAQLLLGYSPPPAPVRPARGPALPNPLGEVPPEAGGDTDRGARPGLTGRVRRLAQLVLGYRPPRLTNGHRGNGAWRPPAVVAARLANGSHADAGIIDSPAAPVAAPPSGQAGEAAGAWRPPAIVAADPEDAGLLTAAPVATNGVHRNGSNGSRGHRLSSLAQLVLGYSPPPPPPARAGSAPARRWPWTRLVNLAGLAVGGAMASWLRNLRTTAPALGSITLLLLVGGVLAVGGFALDNLLVSQSAEASVLHVYLADDATSDQTDQARQALRSLTHVHSVTYIDKDQALALARQRPALSELATASGSNPFPASFEVRVDQPGNVGAVAQAAATEPGVDSQRPTSYDQGTYQRLRQFTTVAISVAGGFALLMLVITYAISSNSIRAAVLARKDELQTMQLVGASPWLVRARLAVEGGLTGGLAGLMAAAVVVAACVAAYLLARQLFVQVLPGVTVPAAGRVVAAVVIVGVGLGAISALFAFRRLRS